MAEQPVWIDRDSIDKVMMNLLSNAFKYTPDEGTIEIDVEVGTDDHEKGPLRNYVEVSVSDIINAVAGKAQPEKLGKALLNQVISRGRSICSLCF